MNTIACKESIFLILCLEGFPHEIIDIITNFIVVSNPPKLLVKISCENYCTRCNTNLTSFLEVRIARNGIAAHHIKNVDMPILYRDIRIFLSKYRDCDVIESYERLKVNFMKHIITLIIHNEKFNLEFYYHSICYYSQRDIFLSNLLKFVNDDFCNKKLYEFACS